MSWLNLIERAEVNLSKKNKFLVERPTECVTWNHFWRGGGGTERWF